MVLKYIYSILKSVYIPTYVNNVTKYKLKKRRRYLLDVFFLCKNVRLLIYNATLIRTFYSSITLDIFFVSFQRK